MKLNKLTSAVSVSLLAVALTACGGSDDDAPIINNNASTPAPAPTPTPAPTPAVVDNSANIAALTAAFKLAGVADAKAAELAAANPTITIGGAEFTALANANKAPVTNADANNAVSETVVRSNPNIKDVDTTKQATVVADHYTRQPGSNFDRRANPAEGLAGGLGAIGTDDPTINGNPYLSNYVLGVEKQGNAIVAIDSTGELVVRDTNTTSGPNVGQGRLLTASERSPYVNQSGARYTTATLNDGNKDFNYFAAANTATNNEFYNTQQVNASQVGVGVGAGVLSVTTQANNNPTIFTIQQVNSQNVVVNSGQVTSALNAVTNLNPSAHAHNGNGALQVTPSGGSAALFNGGGGATSGLVVYNSASPDVGNADGVKLGYKTPVFGVEENIYDADGVALNAVDKAQAPSSSSVHDANRNLNIAFLAPEVVQYSALDSTSGTNRRLYIEKFKASGETANTSAANAGAIVNPNTANIGGSAASPVTHLANPVANRYETRVFGKNYNSYESGAIGTQKSPNTYVARYNSKDQLSNVGVNVLQYTQYGRLTNNIDVLANANPNNQPVTYRQFQAHGADNSVDTYFYRGTHHTTLAQMDEIKKQGGTIQYYGHALTYGVGPKVVEQKTGTLPTSYGLTSSEATIGNFVQAKYDIAKGKVDGSVYNFINSNLNANTTGNSNFKKQDLIKFTGDVYGNSVVGTAEKQGTKEAGTFTGSFYGASANELGGSISSITRSEGYAQPKWGAVFGATRGSVVENFNVIEQGN